MKVTVHNFSDKIAKKMVEKMIELIAERENVKITYEIVEE